MLNSRLGLTILLAGTLLISGCSPVKTIHGNILEEKDIAKLAPFESTQSDVMRVLGSPSTKSIYDDNTWYYIGQNMEREAFFDQEVTERKVYAVRFTEEGYVASVDELNSEGYDIPYSDRTTPTSGHSLTLMQQLLGNIGRFNSEKTNPATNGL